MLVAVGRCLAEDGLFAGGGGSFGAGFGAGPGVFIASRIPCISGAGAAAGAAGAAGAGADGRDEADS